MSEYRRWHVPGGTYFFTVVTASRRPLFADSQAISILRQAWRTVRRKWPFEMVASVLLPDHFHVVISLQPGDDRYALRLGKLKEHFTRKFLACGGKDGLRSESRIERGEHGLWQRRFWEHLCQDEDDLQEKIDYIHWNPVKHGLVKHVRDYKWSSFRRFAARGDYPLEWGNTADTAHIRNLDWE